MGTVWLSVSVAGERYGREIIDTIAIAAIDIQHYIRIFTFAQNLVSAVQLLGAVHRDEIQGVKKLYFKQSTATALKTTALTSSCCT